MNRKVAPIDTNIVLDLVTNDVVYAELSARFAAMPRAVLLFAGKAFQRCWAAGGTRTGVLPDFFVGAHAAVTRLTLLTRDALRYRSYFPTIDLVTP